MTKVAILHDYLNQFGGAERVLKTLVDMFPEADIYTLLYDETRTKNMFKGKIKGTSFLDNAFIRSRHRMLIPFMPLASRSVSLKDDYDLIISSSAGYAKGFGSNALHKKTFHVCYCHSPLRYAWEIDYLKDIPNSPWPLTQFFAKPIAELLRRWDLNVSGNVNVFMTNSEFISNKVRSYYNRDSHVVHPPVDLDRFYLDSRSQDSNEGYYLMVGRLLYYKMFDLGIEAFNKLNRPLKIIGAGPEYFKLNNLAKNNIEFIRDVSDDQLRLMYNNAEALIFPQVEDFGLVAAEAQSCGLPVIAYKKGGGKEIVEDGKTGLFFNEQTKNAVINAVERFEKQSFNREYIARRSQRFSEENFKEGVLNVLKDNGIII